MEFESDNSKKTDAIYNEATRRKVIDPLDNIELDEETRAKEDRQAVNQLAIGEPLQNADCETETTLAAVASPSSSPKSQTMRILVASAGLIGISAAALLFL